MSSALATFLKTSIPTGLSYEEAVQLFLHTFCQAGVVPPELAPFTSKDQMAAAYAQLAREGWIRLMDASKEIPGSPTHSDHWTELVRHLLLKRIPYDSSQGERLERLLRP